MHCAECTSQFCQVQCKRTARRRSCPMNDRARLNRCRPNIAEPDVQNVSTSTL